MVLVTGGTGFIGSHLVYELLRRGSEVKVLVRESSDRTLILKTFGYYCPDPEILFSRIHWAIGDVTDIVALEQAFEGVDRVFHLAAVVSFGRKQKATMMKVNVQGTTNIVNLCLDLGIQKLCFVSSIAAIAVSSDGSPADERLVMKIEKNASTYSVSKLKSEFEVWRAAIEGLPAVIVNPSVVLGPGDWEKGSPRLFDLIAGGFRFYTSGSTGFVDVRDVVQCMVELMNSDTKAERFILNAENLTYKDFYDKVFMSLGRKQQGISLGRFFAGVLVVIDSLWSHILRNEPKLSRETVRLAYKMQAYSNRKICETLNISFRPVSESLRDIAVFHAKHEN